MSLLEKWAWSSWYCKSRMKTDKILLWLMPFHSVTFVIFCTQNHLFLHNPRRRRNPSFFLDQCLSSNLTSPRSSKVLHSSVFHFLVHFIQRMIFLLLLRRIHVTIYFVSTHGEIGESIFSLGMMMMKMERAWNIYLPSFRLSALLLSLFEFFLSLSLFV